LRCRRPLGSSITVLLTTSALYVNMALDTHPVR
jgi:hypothetical protein